MTAKTRMPMSHSSSESFTYDEDAYEGEIRDMMMIIMIMSNAVSGRGYERTLGGASAFGCTPRPMKSEVDSI